MTDKEIIEGNKLIAKFRGFRATLVEMDIYTKEEIYKVESDTHLFADRFRINDVAIEEGFDKNNPEEYFWKVFGKKINYHSDWNLLMSVVEKIEKLPVLWEKSPFNKMGYTSEFEKDHWYEIKIQANYCEIYEVMVMVGDDCIIYDKGGKTKIEATWLAVVEFIKWYNLQPSWPICGHCGYSVPHVTYNEEYDVDECDDCKKLYQEGGANEVKI